MTPLRCGIGRTDGACKFLVRIESLDFFREEVALEGLGAFFDDGDGCGHGSLRTRREQVSGLLQAKLPSTSATSHPAQSDRPYGLNIESSTDTHAGLRF